MRRHEQGPGHHPDRHPGPALREVPGSPGRGQRVLERLLAAPYSGPSTEQLMALTRGEG